MSGQTADSCHNWCSKIPRYTGPINLPECLGSDGCDYCTFKLGASSGKRWKFTIFLQKGEHQSMTSTVSIARMPSFGIVALCSQNMVARNIRPWMVTTFWFSLSLLSRAWPHPACFFVNSQIEPLRVFEVWVHHAEIEVQSSDACIATVPCSKGLLRSSLRTLHHHLPSLIFLFAANAEIIAYANRLFEARPSHSESFVFFN